VATIDISAQLDAIAASTSRLLGSVADLDNRAMAAPSLLPGWNRAQVLTHLARNADGFAGMYAAARRGEVGQMYPGGPIQREADIDVGRHRPAARVIADLSGAVRGLADEAGRLRPDEWDRPGEMSAGRVALWQTLLARRRETEVHHADLGVGYGPEDWPADFVSAELAVAAAALLSRLDATPALRLVSTEGTTWEASLPGHDGADITVVTGPPGQLLAWLLGRPTTLESRPDIKPWQ
jgi:maleylpyruvate isomerase